MDKQLNNPLALQEDSILFGMNGTEHGKFKAGFLGVHNLLHVQDRKPETSDGGAFTVGAWRTRDLNTVVINNINATLLNNTVTLGAGFYFLDFSTIVTGVSSNTSRLFNVTLQSTEVWSQTRYVGTGDFDTPTLMSGFFTLADVSILEVQSACHYSDDRGFGHGGFDASYAKDYNLFSDLKIWKLT